ncbi:hypothetical protein BGZ82_002274, partial [Podila clonocystis]
MLASMGSRKGRVDVLSFYSVIRNAYSHHTPEKAHSILEQHLLRFGSKSNLILYIDGEPALEKQDTAKHRKESQEKATIKCMESLDKLEVIIINSVKPRKRHFTDVKTSLATTFCWSLQHRQSFIEYMKQAEWSVRVCKMEADVAIAVDCQLGDIVISADSDMLAYGSVSTLWRPISKYLVLTYKLADVCLQLGLTQNHLTALAVVSSNDYSRNIYSLGPATNYSIIKSLDAQDMKSIVTAYLGHITVSTKNMMSETFNASLRVFVNMKQTPIGPQYASTPDFSFSDLQMRFGDLCSLYEQVKKSHLPEMSTSMEQLVRLTSSQTLNRFKTVESPVFIKAHQTVLQTPALAQPVPEAQSQQLASVTEWPQQLTLTTQGSSSPLELASHPPLPRTRIPRHRHQYSFKRHDWTQTKRRPPPPKMKQFVEKPYKEPERKPEKPKPKPKPKPALKLLSNSMAQSEKLAITQLMTYQHPTTSLFISTLSANVKRALPDQDSLQLEVMAVLLKAASEAARIKRKGQTLIGKYIEHLDENGVNAEDQKFLDLLCPRVSMKDVKDDADDATEDDKDGDEIVGEVEDKEEEEDDGDEDDTDLGGTGGNGKVQQAFLRSFLSYLYSGNYPRNSEVSRFIDHLEGLRLYNPPRTQSEINQTMPFTPSDLVRSVIGQLKGELKRMYKIGTCALHKILLKK